MPLLLLGLRTDLSGKLYPAANIYCDVVGPSREKRVYDGNDDGVLSAVVLMSCTAITTTPKPVNRKKAFSVQMVRQAI